MGLRLSRFTVGDNERVLLFKDGRLKGILNPGEHFVWHTGVVTYEHHDSRKPEFNSEWTDFLLRSRPKLTDRYFTVVTTRESQVAVISIGDRVLQVLEPSSRAVFWKDAGVTARVFDIAREPQVPAELVAPILRLGRKTAITHAVVDDGRTGLVFVDGRLFGAPLASGAYAFWTALSDVKVVIVDIRLQSIEIKDQNVMTRDRVALVVATWAEYVVVDPVEATLSVRDWAQHLRTCLHVEVLQAVGPLTLEEALVQRADIDAMLTVRVREKMQHHGVSVRRIAIKDIGLAREPREKPKEPTVTIEKTPSPVLAPAAR